MAIVESRSIQDAKRAIRDQGFDGAYEVCISLDGQLKTFTIDEFKQKLGFK